MLHLFVASLTIAANPFAPIFDPLVRIASQGMDFINAWTHNYGWTMLIMAFAVQVLMLPFTVRQYQSMQEMQALGPYLKRLQAKHKNDRQKLSEETLALYKQHGVNPLGGCLPMLLQYPFLIAIYYAIFQHNDQFKNATWLWIQPGACGWHAFGQQIFGCSLFDSDKLLLAVYAVSLYFSMALSPTAAMDEQQQQMMKWQTAIMPFMFFFLGATYHWSAAFIIYWTGFALLGLVERSIIMRLPTKVRPPEPQSDAERAGFPRTCPNCNASLVIVKGNRCEACGNKVRKTPPQPKPEGAAAS